MLYENSSLNLTFWKIYKKKRIKRRKKRRRRGKHLYSFFLSRSKKFSLYYLQFDSSLQKRDIKVDFKSSYVLQKKTHRVGLKALKLDLVRIICLKGLKFSSQKFLRSVYLDKYLKYNVSKVPDYWLTSKAKSIRMGKGKGEMRFKISFIKKGVDLYNITHNYRIYKYVFDRKLFIYKFNIFFWFLMKILKSKPSMKNLIYKKLY